MSKSKEIIFEDWEKIRCSICLEHPHQAILLVCASYEKGCRPYICDTGPNHSHCFTKLKCLRNKIVCPLCRGKVKDCKVDARSRQLLNHKPRTCAYETCEFSGSYMELENHVKLVHPSAAGPSGEQPMMNQDAWDLELYVNQLDLGRGEPCDVQQWISRSQ